MSLFYYGLVTLLYCIALPYLIYLCFKVKYKDSIPARFFLKNNTPFTRHGIWFHACSFGEVRSLSPFINKLESYDIQVSVITQTGFKEASAYQKVQVRYLPFELFLPFWIVQQNVLIVMEAELWPLLFVVAKKRGMRTVLLNARISDRSYNSYQRFRWFYAWIFKHIDLVVAQSLEDQKRLHQLGADEVYVGGNIKCFTQYHVSYHYKKLEHKRVVLLASTHEGEEALILSKLMLKKNDQLIVVPRHPERFEKINTFLYSYAHERALSYHRLSEGDETEADVILCDKMGELINLYAIADCVILGGSFIDGIGGHNPLEPAFFGTHLISGKFIFNQKVLFDLVENHLMCEIDELSRVFDSIELSPKSTIVHHSDVMPLLEKILGKENGKSV